MRYYTIQNNGLLIAENKQALERFYDNVLSLPDDYEQGKYIASLPLAFFHASPRP